MKRKAKTAAQIADACAVLLQKIVRMKAAIAQGSPHISCVTCGKWDHWKSMQGGHYISRRRTATKCLEENIHPQCPGCNGPRGGCPQEYALYMIEMYGVDFVADLTELSHQTKKWVRPDLMDFQSELKALTKSLEAVVPV